MIIAFWFFLCFLVLCVGTVIVYLAVKKELISQRRKKELDRPSQGANARN